ncbi:MAG: hypothetical protein JWP61_2776, partial [Friedmanniella sp.]|nr:hypothetical protein [Friedmanniella sp.]
MADDEVTILREALAGHRKVLV